MRLPNAYPQLTLDPSARGVPGQIYPSRDEEQRSPREGEAGVVQS
jgi:hypothetical protein